MNILIGVSSEIELDYVSKSIESMAQSKNALGEYKYFDHTIFILNHHAGQMACSYYLTKYYSEHPVDLAIQVGIAGASNHLNIGEVYIIAEDECIDLGAFENGDFKTIFDLNLEDRNEFPFQNGKLVLTFPEEYIKKFELQKCNAITVNTIMDEPLWCEERLAIGDSQLESMEGAAFYYVSNNFCIPSLQIRSISNHVGERDKNKWNIALAMENAISKIQKIIEIICTN